MPFPATPHRALEYPERARSTQYAWDVDYAGHAHEVLLANINQMSRGGSYTNMVSFIQSSGSGKSRMVREQAKLVFTIPFNLRDITNSEPLAWPPPDIDVFYHLTQSVPNIGVARIRYLQFFRYLFRVVREAVQCLSPDGSSYDDYSALALDWHEHMEKEDVRYYLYQKVLGLCIADELEGAAELRSGMPSDNRKRSASTVTKEACQESQELIDALDHCVHYSARSTRNVKIMMCFDEAHVLLDTGHRLRDSDCGDFFDVLSQCIDALSDKPIFSIFISSDTRISKRTPHASRARSVRFQQDMLRGPITETPFDNCNLLPIKKSDMLRLINIIEIQFLAQFGRPLFWTYVDGPTGESRQTQLMDSIRQKLLCSETVDMSHHFYQGTAALTAVLDILLNLKFESSQAAAARQTELVANHLRVVYSIPSHCEHFQSGYPSEPILAEVAVQRLDLLQSLALDTNVFATLLQSHFDSDILDQGQRSEVVMRQLLLTAYMRACKKDKIGSFHAPFSGGCRLVTFIKGLFSEQHAQVVLDSRPNNYTKDAEESKPLRDAFKDAILRFTHFGKMADDSDDPSTHILYAAFIRCMAMICYSSRGDVNIVLPILLSKDEVLSEAVMSGLHFRVKRWHHSKNYEIDSEPFNIFLKEDSRPYISIAAELGAFSSEELPGFDSNLHPCYSVLAHGCSDAIYKVIEARDRKLYASLLTPRDLLDEHERQDADSLAQIRRMKPFWSTGDSYDWIVDDCLNNRPPEMPNTETWVTVGLPKD